MNPRTYKNLMGRASRGHPPRIEVHPADVKAFALPAHLALKPVLTALAHQDCDVTLSHKERLHLRNAGNILARLQKGARC